MYQADDQPDFDAITQLLEPESLESTSFQNELRCGRDILAELGTLSDLIDTLDKDGLTGADDAVVEAAPVSEHPEVHALAELRRVATDPCVVCGCPTARAEADIEDLSEQLVTCEGCGLGTLFPIPDAQRIQSFYPPAYYGSPDAKFEPLVEFGVRAGARFRVKRLAGSLPRGARVLDVGCGRGVMLRALLDLGYEAHGVEISTEAAAGADPRATVHIAPDLTQAALPDQFFDAVILWHVLEHLPHPDRVLAELHRILKPGGRLILAVPNYASWQARLMKSHWFHLDLPRPLYHFTPRTLKRLLQQSGFRCRSLRHFALLQNPFGWLQSLLNRFTSTPRNALYTLLHQSSEAVDASGLTARQRLTLRAAYWLGLPVAGLLSVVEAMFRAGGTMAVVAERSVVTGPSRRCHQPSTPTGRETRRSPAKSR